MPPVRCIGRWALRGLALVDGAVKVGSAGHWMDQFFVMKKYRRDGVGRALALRAFAELPDRWEVRQMMNNHLAQAFWRKVIGEHTQGRYEEHELASGWWQGVVQCFNSASPARRGIVERIRRSQLPLSDALVRCCGYAGQSQGTCRLAPSRWLAPRPPKGQSSPVPS